MASTAETFHSPTFATPNGNDRLTAPSFLATAPTNSNSTSSNESQHPNMAAQTASGDPMDIGSPTHDASNNTMSSTEPATAQSTETNRESRHNDGVKTESPPDTSNNTGSNGNEAMNATAPPPAAAALHQPKIVQTAFIHKLYK